MKNVNYSAFLKLVSAAFFKWKLCDFVFLNSLLSKTNLNRLLNKIKGS